MLAAKSGATLTRRVYHIGSAACGFGCKVRLAAELGRKHFAGRHHTWFSSELNPIQNGDSSNPLKIFESLDRAVKLGDVNHPKIKDLRLNLMQAADFLLKQDDLVEEIRTAGLGSFHPQLWRIRVESVDAGRVRRPVTNNGWDEQYIEDLREDEFEVIAD